MQAGGGGKARDPAQEGSTQKEPALRSLGGPKPTAHKPRRKSRGSKTLTIGETLLYRAEELQAQGVVPRNQESS